MRIIINKNGFSAISKFIALTILLSVATAPAWSQSIKSVKLATEEWENNTNADGTGSFFEIIEATFAMSDIKMEFVIVPYERSVEMTRNGEVDAWVASYDEEEDFALFPEWHFDADIVTAVYKKDRFPDFDGEESLNGKTVSWIRGYAYDEYIEEDMQIYRLDKRKSAMEMLVRDRIDIYLDAQAEVSIMTEDPEYNRTIKFNPESFEFQEILRLELFLAFTDAPRSRELITIWDTNFPKLVESGEVKRIYDKYGVEDYPF
jgi:polar amino acid transport system substrate-binding protein